jgi:group I intron endonuclease
MVTIYGLVHKASGCTYVGCTKANLLKRMREHRCLLNAGKHASPSLQRDWNEFGEKAFDLVILEQLPNDCTVIQKRAAELHWMQVHADKLYNENQTSFRPTDEAIKKGVIVRANNLRGSKQSEETKRKRSIAQLGIPKNHGEKIKATKLRNKLAKLAAGQLMR